MRVSNSSVTDISLPENAISVPVDLYHKAIKKLRREWIEENGGLVAVLSSFPFTGQHGLVKVRVFFHPKRDRCFYIGSQLADLVERDTDGDPFVAILDEPFIRQCAAPYEYARAVRDAVNSRIGNILKEGKAGKLTTTVDSEQFWQPVPSYGFLPTERQQRAAGCMIDDNMGMADNAVRLLKYQYRKYANRIAHERPGVIWGPERDALIWQNYEMDVDLACAFMALSQQAVGEKEGQTVEVLPQVAKQYPVGSGKRTVPVAMNAPIYLEMMGLDLPGTTRILRQQFSSIVKLFKQPPAAFRVVNKKTNPNTGILEPGDPNGTSKNPLNPVDGLAKLAYKITKSHEDNHLAANDVYSQIVRLFDGKLWLSDRVLGVEQLEQAISEVLTSEYGQPITISKQDWFSRIRYNLVNTTIDEVYDFANVWNRFYSANKSMFLGFWHSCLDCPICGKPTPQCECVCPDCGKPLFGKATKRCKCRNWYADCRNRVRDWDLSACNAQAGEARHRLDEYIENQALSYEYKDKRFVMVGFHCRMVGIQKSFIAEFSSKADAVIPESVRQTIRRHMLINCLFGDFNTTNDGKVHGYGNSVVACKYLDLPFWSKVMVKLHDMVGLIAPTFLLEEAGGRDVDVALNIDGDGEEDNQLPFRLTKHTGLQALPGVGPKLAKVITAELGDNAYNAIIEKPDILSGIKGIGDVKYANIREFVDGIHKDEASQQQAAD